jgi:transcriptional regulator
MYTPRFNQVTDRAVLFEAMRANSFAILFGPLTAQDDAHPATATHLPLVIKDEGEHGVIEGHFARANPHWSLLDGRETLVVFSGPHSYVSPSLYTERQSVPTWNYIAVHASGTLATIHDEVAKHALLRDLIQSNEPAYLEQWLSLPEHFRHGMLTGIVGFRILITRIEGKFKISQNRSEADRCNVQNAQASGSLDEQSLASWMKRFGL